MCRILGMLGKRRLVIVSPYASASMILVAKAVVEALRRYERIILVDGGGFRPEALEALGGRVVLDRVLVQEPGEKLHSPPLPVAAYNAGGFLQDIPADRLLAASVLSSSDVPRSLKRSVLRVSRISPGLYLLKMGGRACLAEISVGRVAPARPRGLEARALSLLSRLVAEYGAVEVRDAVSALSSELGVDRGRARRILVGLAGKKLVSIEKGFVLVDYTLG